MVRARSLDVFQVEKDKYWKYQVIEVLGELMRNGPALISHECQGKLEGSIRLASISHDRNECQDRPEGSGPLFLTYLLVIALFSLPQVAFGTFLL